MTSQPSPPGAEAVGLARSPETAPAESSLAGVRQQLAAVRTTTPQGALLATLALITPAGLVVVNIAAWVMSHLAAFRVGITVSAVVSTLVLNGLTMVALYRVGLQRWPDFEIFRVSRQRSMTAVGAFLLLLMAAVAGELTYRGLSDARQLPNLSTFLAGLVGLVVPLVLALLLRDNASPRARRRYRTR